MEEIHFWILLGVSLCALIAAFRADAPDWLLYTCLFGVGIGGVGGWLEREENKKEEEAYWERISAESKGRKAALDIVLPDLIPCVTCKKKISKRAETCVGCGEKVSRSWDYYGTTEGIVELSLSPEEMERYKKLIED